uniref:Transcription factor E3 n=1 Tax=Magallana gigas TaxID=29159 RepID=K1Q051_MAGGI
MTSMFQASKQLQEIRKQLKQMDEQYRDGFKADSMENSSDAISKADSNQISASGTQDKVTGSHENLENATITQGHKTQSNFHSFLSNVSVSHVNDFEHVESVLSSLIEDSPDDSQDIMPLSHELRQAITNMEDIEDVDSLIGNVINSVQIDSSYDEDLHCIEQAVACTIVGSDINIYVRNNSNEEYLKVMEKSSTTDNPQPRPFISKEEEQLWKKDRIKKDNHNIIERRRRYNINDRIKELATLLPPTTHPAMKLNKGSILKASVEYVRELKKDKEKLVLFESKQKTMEAKYQKMLIRIFQLELKMKLYGLTEDMDRVQTKRKKRPRRRLCEIDAMVEDLMKQTLPSKQVSNENSTISSTGRQPVSDVEQTKNVAILQTDEHSDQFSAADSSPSPADEKITSPVLSPVTLTTNMLEALLRKNDRGSLSSSSSGTQSLESSTDSTGLK